MHFIDRQGTIAALVILIAAYTLHSHGLFAVYHLVRAAELMRIFH